MHEADAVTPPGQALQVDDLPPIEVGPGCTRRALPTVGGLGAWVVDMAPGSQWPYVDQHDASGERFYVASGELIEGNERFRTGTYVIFAANSKHRPRTESGVRLFGFYRTD